MPIAEIADLARPLAGHTVLVTGAAGDGIGSGICAALHAAGAQLVMNDRDPGLLHAAVARYEGATGVVADVSNPVDAARLVDQAGETGTFSGLVNNAGVGLSMRFHESTEEDFDRVFDTDVRGLWLVTRAFATRLLRTGDEGAIVNVSSVHARATVDTYAIYAAAKSAVEGITRGMAVELGAHRIRCNAIAPGYVHAAQNVDLLRSITSDPAAWVDHHTNAEQVVPRLIDPLDCGWAVMFLLSDLSRGITGHILTVDAGLGARLYAREVGVGAIGGAR